MAYSPNNPYVRIGVNGRLEGGISDIDNLDDLRAHMQREDSWIKVWGDAGVEHGQRYVTYIKIRDIIWWSVTENE